MMDIVLDSITMPHLNWGLYLWYRTELSNTWFCFFDKSVINVYYVPDSSFVHLVIDIDYIGEVDLTITIIDDSSASSSKPCASG